MVLGVKIRRASSQMGRILLYFYHHSNELAMCFHSRHHLKKLHEIEELRAHGHPTIITDYITMINPCEWRPILPFYKKRSDVYNLTMACMLCHFPIMAGFIDISIYRGTYIYISLSLQIIAIFLQHVKPQIPCFAKSIIAHRTYGTFQKHNWDDSNEYPVGPQQLDR